MRVLGIFFSVLAFWFLALFPANAGPLTIEEINAYLNGFPRGKVSFEQIASDGSRSTGWLFLRRPGRLRMEYDPPHKGLVIIGGNQVAVFDHASDASPMQFPLNRTPLKILLKKEVDLRPFVEKKAADETTTLLVLKDREGKAEGALGLWFLSNPVRLDRWVFVSNDGDKTEMHLGTMMADSKTKNIKFDITAEIERRITK